MTHGQDRAGAGGSSTILSNPQTDRRKSAAALSPVSVLSCDACRTRAASVSGCGKVMCELCAELLPPCPECGRPGLER